MYESNTGFYMCVCVCSMLFLCAIDLVGILKQPLKQKERRMALFWNAIVLSACRRPRFYSFDTPPTVLWPAYSRTNHNPPSVNMASDFRWKCVLLLLCLYLLSVLATDSKDKPKKKKDIRDYNDADMARLLEQWEVRSPDGFHSASIHTLATL